MSEQAEAKNFLRRLTDSSHFQNFIIFVILAAGVVVGIQTSASMEAKYGTILGILDTVILWIFATEAMLKIIAQGKKPWRYWHDPWNCFDFTIVVVAFLPIGASYVAVLRLARILRVLRLASMLPRLQLLVNALLKSIPSMGYVGLLLFMLFYIYAVLGTTLWGKNDPIHFGNLWVSMLSLFRAVTLEDWTDLMYINMYGSANYGYSAEDIARHSPESSASPIGGALFFVSFVMIGTMIVLNLFIGVIMNSMQAAQDEREKADRVTAKRKESGDAALSSQMHGLQDKVDDLKSEILLLHGLLEAEVSKAGKAPQKN